jgi:putative acetyltransferase
LIEAGLAQLKDAGWEGVFVDGEPAYYQRFGFSADLARGFQSPYSGPFLMALSLGERELPVTSGPIKYAPAFAALG